MLFSKRNIYLGKYLITNLFYSVTQLLEHSTNYMIFFVLNHYLYPCMILELGVSSIRNADATFTQHTDCRLQNYEGMRNRVT